MFVPFFRLPLFAFVSIIAVASIFAQAPEPKTLRVYLGTYTGKGSEGIYLAELDLTSGKLSQPELAAKTVNPSFLALHPSKPVLYAVNEVGTVAGKAGGTVTAFAINTSNGNLAKLNTLTSGGQGPCHLCVDGTGKCVLVANYNSGSVACLTLQENGSFGNFFTAIQHMGSSVNRQRQEGPHAHCVEFDAANRFVFVADLGLDKVMIYQLHADQGTLMPNNPPYITLPPGSGPRHFVFHPQGKFAYVNHEMTSAVTAFAYNAQEGKLKQIQSLSTLPANFRGNNSTAEIQVHPNGKFLYVSNRGHDSIARFDIAANGLLTLKGHTSTQGKTPRHFRIDPTGKFLLVANQNSNNVVVFRIDPATGSLTFTRAQISLSMPVCVTFAAP